MKYKKIIALLFFIAFISILRAQTSINKSINDTISVEKLSKKIELEQDLALSEKWNIDFLKISLERKQLKNLNPKIKYFYEKSYLTALLNQAYFEDAKGNKKKSIEIYIQVLKNSDKVKSNYILASTNTSIANAYVGEKEYVLAEKYFKKAIHYATIAKMQDVISIIYGNLAFLYMQTNQKDLGIKYYFKSLEIKKKEGELSSAGVTLNNIASFYRENKEYDKSYNYYLEAVKYQKLAKNDGELARLYKNLSSLCQILKKNNEYVQYLNQAYVLSKKSKHLETLNKSSKALYNDSRKNGDFKKALLFLEDAVKTDSILYKEENKNAMLKADFKYETEKKEAKITELSQKKKIAELESKRKTSFLFIFGILFFAIATTAYVLFSKFKTKKQNEILQNQLAEIQKLLEAEKKVTDSELKALKSQMNPHFIFNALNSIQSQFMFGDKLVANEQLNNFTYLTRQILEVSGKKNIAIADEVDILTKYLELEQMRFKKDLTYYISVSENIDEDYHKIPPMLIQPIVENSIKHGLLHQVGDKNVSVNFDISSDESHLICTIIDNGIGRQKSAAIKSKSNLNHNSFSTNAIEERLELLNNNLKLNDLIVYIDVLNNENEVCGTKVILKIPLV